MLDINVYKLNYGNEDDDPPIQRSRRFIKQFSVYEPTFCSWVY